MTRCLFLAAAALCAVPVVAQAQDDKLKARCNQLYAMADRALSRRGEGGGGPNMIVQSAGIDCQKGRYEQGIRDLEKVLRAQGYTVPPAP
ncbi:MAG: hypothetical protein J0J01_02095 [Reyranella sp.]|uniref:hypothetical protein n=1 Tax=Reyranella sp. TaxID=1929291 RepID=UPI001AD293E8|nr:hypothetical protein [Reyranella sp.]MBN9085674.1 hypothetical protein [Reyranella sp.]